MRKRRERHRTNNTEQIASGKHMDKSPSGNSWRFKIESANRLGDFESPPNLAHVNAVVTRLLATVGYLEKASAKHRVYIHNARSVQATYHIGTTSWCNRTMDSMFFILQILTSRSLCFLCVSQARFGVRVGRCRRPRVLVEL